MEAQIDDNYELLCRLWSPLVGAEEGGYRPLSPVALKELKPLLLSTQNIIKKLAEYTI